MTGSRVMRVDHEVYGRLLEVKHRLEMATGKVVSISRTCAFLVALSVGESQGRPRDDRPEEPQG